MPLPSMDDASPLRRTRGALACLACRAAKSKCDGQQPDKILAAAAASSSSSSSSSSLLTQLSPNPCSRCAMHKLPCRWKPCQRTGRPRKQPTQPRPADSCRLPASPLAATDIATSGDYRDKDGDIVPATLPPRASATRTADPSAWIAGLDLDASSAPNLGALYQASSSTAFATPFSWDALDAQLWPQPLEAYQDTAVSSESLSSSAATTDDSALSPSDQMRRLAGLVRPHSALVHSSSASASPLDTLPQSDVVSLGLSRFFDSFALSVPVLGEADDFLNRLSPRPSNPAALSWDASASSSSAQDRSEDLAASLSAKAAAVIGHSLYLGTSSEQATSLLASLETSIEARGDGTSTEQDAATCLDRIVCHLLLSYAYYGRNFRDKASHQLDCALAVARKASLDSLDDAAPGFGPFSSSPGKLKEAGRRAWWEICIADVMMSSSTSGEIPRRLNTQPKAQRVRIPQDLGSTSSSVYMLRIEAVYLMAECITEHATPSVERLSSLDGILANLIARAQTAWLTAARALASAGRVRAPKAAATREVCLFDTAVLLHACRIQLHRKAWFADLTLGLDSCSFKTQVTDRQDPDQRQMQVSVGRILEASRNISRLIRYDLDLTFEEATSSPLSSLSSSVSIHGSAASGSAPPHWPFIGCCLMIGAYGGWVSIASTSSSPPEAQSTPSTSNHSSDTSDAADRQHWLHREIESGLDLAYTSLERLAAVYPIADVFRDEVIRCREMIGLP
ncbi:uncharacterized protein PFL1_00319 [Pseudozyma flocculosa PF-1]|uniref:uncharacterized protein n=1 Tax=Pseudozyma flocculosa PF-1 TaxID=1277687 RepID=UPI0004561858|nr:uncharacterized protein PFL1_00319 [Pseudozyma flocculosa PF-1]EPQ32122.1 hypothetical protein PFL1_00319 [Pseudozyma flocculosa PF-1]